MKYIAQNLVLFSVLFLISCTSDVENRGYVVKFSDFSAIKPGNSNKNQVLEVLGSPTTKSVYGQEKWIYMGAEETKETFFEPEVQNFKAYEITFNESGIVDSIDKKTKDNMREFAVSEDKTETSGNEITFIQQLLGNLGKFNPGRNSGPRSVR